MKTTAEEKFWSRVERRGDDECWQWTGARAGSDRSMHGIFGGDSRHNIYAHRFSYELAKGPIPQGMRVLHSCDNGLCCNPNHLRVGTQSENIREMFERGRNPERRHIDDKQIWDALYLRFEMRMMIKEIAANLGVSANYLSKVFRGQHRVDIYEEFMSQAKAA